MVRPNKNPELWIINISREYDVSIADLRITIRKGAKINLLDRKHYHFTDEQIRNSVTEGSIYKKRSVLIVREVINLPPSFIAIKEVEKNRRVLKPLRHAASKNIPAPNYEELEFEDTQSEEQYAAEQADIDAQDHAPLLPVDQKFKE